MSNTNSTSNAQTGPSKSIIIIPLVLITAFCFSYIQYSSAGNGVSSAGSHATLPASKNAKSFSDAPLLTTTQSELTPMNSAVVTPKPSQTLSNAAALQLSSHSSQNLQDPANDTDTNDKTSNPQRGSSKPQSTKANLELPRL